MWEPTGGEDGALHVERFVDGFAAPLLRRWRESRAARNPPGMDPRPTGHGLRRPFQSLERRTVERPTRETRGPRSRDHRSSSGSPKVGRDGCPSKTGPLNDCRLDANHSLSVVLFTRVDAAGEGSAPKDLYRVVLENLASARNDETALVKALKRELVAFARSLGAVVGASRGSERVQNGLTLSRGSLWISPQSLSRCLHTQRFHLELSVRVRDPLGVIISPQGLEGWMLLLKQIIAQRLRVGS